jgi:hypothetical protein
MAFRIRPSRGAGRGPATAPTATPAIYERPVGAAFTGLLALVIGAWGAIAGYIGPYFDYRPVALQTWVASLPNGLLHLLRGGAFMLPAVLLLAAGAWFVIGPLAWPTFEHGDAFVTGVSATRNLLNIAGSSYAPGLALVMLGGIALKAGSVPPVPVGDPYTPAEAVAPGAGAGAGTGAGTGAPVSGAGAPVEERATVPAAEGGEA